MATIHLPVDQLKFDTKETLLETSSLDSFDSVVDANTDFNLNETQLKTAFLEDDDNGKNDLKDDLYSKGSKHPPKIQIEFQEGCKDSLVCKQFPESLSYHYPKINYEVADFLTQNSPELYDRVSKVLEASLNTPRLAESDSLDSPNHFITPLKAMGSTTEALALQQSVIGERKIQPVSEDVVAQVVADTQKRLQGLGLQPEKLEIGAVVSPLETPNAFQDSHTGNDSSSVPFAQKTSPSSTKSKSIHGVIFKELVQYPHDEITATKEKRAWLFGNPSSPSGSPTLCNSPVRKQKKSTKVRRDSQSSISSVGSISSSKVTLSPDLPATHNVKKVVVESCSNNIKDDNVVSENLVGKHENDIHTMNSLSVHRDQDFDTESERMELESLPSECFDFESTSGLSEADEDMFKIQSSFGEATSPYQAFSSFSETPTILPNTVKLKWKPTTASKETQTTDVLLEEITLATDAIDDKSIGEFKSSVLPPFELLRKKAQLEGKIEILQGEVDKFIKEQTHLQSLVAAMESDIASYKSKLDQENAERKLLQQEVEKLQHENQQWQQVISDYQHVIETKTSDIGIFKKNLIEADNINNKLHVDIEHLKVDLDEKDGAIYGLKKKIAELHIEVHTNMQDKVELENQLKNMKVELEMMKKSKCWYQDQLKTAQDLKNKIHQDLIASQAESIHATNMMEQLRVENCQLKQQLLETQQRAMKEKEILMKHLETIEMDMIERESLFQEVQKQKGSEEKMMAQRLKKVDEEHAELTNLKFLVSDLELQIENSKKDLATKEEHMTRLEKDVAELTRENARLQKTLSKNEISHQKLEQEITRLEGKLKHNLIELSMKEEQIQKMKMEQTAKDVALAAINEEKRTVHEALQKLKIDLNNVEKSFKQMRTELVTKNLEYEQLQKEKDHLEVSLQKTEQRLLQQKHAYEMEVPSQHIRSEMKEVAARNAQLEKDIVSINDELKSYRFQCSLLSMEKEKLEKMIGDIQNASVQFAMQANKEEKIKDHLKLEEMQVKEGTAEHDQGSQQTIAHQVPEVINETLKKEEHSYKNKLHAYECNIKILMRRLREEKKSRQKVENKLQKLKENKVSIDVVCKAVQTQSDSCLPSEIPEAGEEICSHKASLNELNGQFQAIMERYKEMTLTLESKEQLILDLEKENGRLAGITDSHNTMKQHVSELEQELAAKEFNVSELSQKISDLEERHKEEESKLNERLYVLQEQLQKEKALVKELRYQVFQEKRHHNIAKRQLENLKSVLQQANHIADSRQQSITNLNAELQQKVQEGRGCRAEIESLLMKNKQLQLALKKLEKELEESHSRDPALADQMKTLSWHLKQKNQELTALKQQLSLIEERHAVEVKGMNKQLQDLNADVTKMKMELENTRKDKFGYQSQVTELRGALKSSVDQIKHLQEQLSQRNKEVGDLALLDLPPLPNSPAPLDETFINSLLMQSTVSSGSRPLSNLQACLNSLKQEMSELQKQIKEHVDD